MKNFLLSLFLLLVIVPLHSQIDVNFELQIYPTGVIPGLRIEKIHGSKSASHLRLGYNWIRHRDLGKQDDERGDGFGFTIGHKKYFKENHHGLHLGIKSDFWRNSIDWKNNIGEEEEFGEIQRLQLFSPH